MPLHFAVQGGHTAAAIMLLVRGSPVDPKGPAGFTPLHDAAHMGHVAMVRVAIWNVLEGSSNISLVIGLWAHGAYGPMGRSGRPPAVDRPAGGLSFFVTEASPT